MKVPENGPPWKAKAKHTRAQAPAKMISDCLMNEIPHIKGAQSILSWFGYWPTFHDAEVVSIFLDRSGKSEVRIHVFEVTPETDINGYFVSTKHAILTFILEGFLSAEEIGAMHLNRFNHQNVLSDVSLRKVEGGYEVELDGIHGVDGSLYCRELSVRIEPGIPPGSVYQELPLRPPKGTRDKS